MLSQGLAGETETAITECYKISFIDKKLFIINGIENATKIPILSGNATSCTEDRGKKSQAGLSSDEFLEFLEYKRGEDPRSKESLERRRQNHHGANTMLPSENTQHIKAGFHVEKQVEQKPDACAEKSAPQVRIINKTDASDSQQPHYRKEPKNQSDEKSP